MPSKHLVDPEIVAALEIFPTVQIDDASLAEWRQFVANIFAAGMKPLPPDITREERFAPGLRGNPDVRVLMYAPKAQSAGRPAILHIHGGGYVLGAAEIAHNPSIDYVNSLSAVVVAVDYRLAPETPHPGPLEDCYAALTWLYKNAAALGVDENRIAVSGESAGGGLAASLAILARDHKEIPIAFQHLTYPMLDDRTSVLSDPSPYIGQFMWTRASNAYGWSALLGAPPGGATAAPYAAAARADDLSGLPATAIFCGAIDLFVEESLEYSRRLVRAGVPTELHVYPGAPHGFELMADAGVTKTYFRDSFAAMRRGLGIASPPP